METFKCTICGFIYDPVEGDPVGGIEPGIPFVDLPVDYICPICGAGKDEFISTL
jgi:rubredoxin